MGGIEGFIRGWGFGMSELREGRAPDLRFKVHEVRSGTLN